MRMSIYQRMYKCRHNTHTHTPLTIKYNILYECSLYSYSLVDRPTVKYKCFKKNLKSDKNSAPLLVVVLLTCQQFLDIWH